MNIDDISDNNNIIVSISVVLYKTDVLVLNKLINSFSYIKRPLIIFYIDNSPTDLLKEKILSQYTSKHTLKYFFNPSNPGFGSAHNLAIKEALKAGSKYHFVINPDIWFETDVITPLIKFIHSDNSIGMVMPQILNYNGTVQNLPKILPTPFSIIFRKLKWPVKYYKKFISKYELRSTSNSIALNVPVLSGCFNLLRLEYIKEIGMFDDRFFMYFEDWDLSRRMHRKYKTIFYLSVSVFHGYDSGANKSFRLLKTFVRSAITYFNKWGWFFDKEREKMNKVALSQL